MLHNQKGWEMQRCNSHDYHFSVRGMPDWA